MRSLVSLSLISVLSATAFAAPPDIPRLAWQERSDWINVKTDVTPAAAGDGRVDDTTAVQAAIDAARQAGRGAIAYLPTGRYRISQTLSVTGRDYAVGGSGFRCGFVWRGEAGRPMIEVSGVRDVTLANMTVGGHDFGTMNHGVDMHVTSPPHVPCRLVLDEVYAYGMYQKAPDQPEGAVTIQGAKMHMFSQKPVFDIRNYAGRIYYGQSQFYIEPKEPRRVSEGTRAVRLILAGHFWYKTRPRFELTPAVKLTLLGNREIPDAGVDEGALSATGRALDDLRRLGELDHRLSHQRQDRTTGPRLQEQPAGR